MTTLDNMDTELDWAIENINQNIAYWESLAKELMEVHPKHWDELNSYQPGKTIGSKLLECENQIYRCNQTKKELTW